MRLPIKGYSFYCTIIFYVFRKVIDATTISWTLLDLFLKIDERTAQFVYNRCKERGEKMSNQQTETQQEIVESEEINQTDTPQAPTTPYFGYSLLRDVLIPELLSNDTNEISYWAGKQLARKFPLSSVEEISGFFVKAGWGQLTILKTEKYNIEMELTGEVVKRRFTEYPNSSFHLEAGFVAEQVQQLKNCLTETYLTNKEKADKVLFSVQWDKKDIITPETRTERYKK